MCFSASASFTTGALMSGIGLLSIYYARKTPLVPLAIVPLLFALQQYAEGIIWLSLQWPIHPILIDICIYTFLSIALIVWPLWIPIFIYQYIPSTVKYFTVTAGICTACLFLVNLSQYSINAWLHGCHIYYDVEASYWSSFLYMSAVVMPLFFAQLRFIKFLAINIFISCVITHLFFWLYFISIWCFFAAGISTLILLIIYCNRSRFIPRVAP